MKDLDWRSNNTYVSLPVVKKQVQASQYYYFIIQLTLLYILSWITVSNNLSTAFRFSILVLLLIMASRSYQNSAIILLFVLFIPFYKNLIGVAGLDAPRVLFLPFFWFSINRPSIRPLPVNHHLAIVLLLAILSIKVSADILSTVQEEPLSLGQSSRRGFENMVASYLDLVIIVYFIYSVFTRFTFFEIKRLLDLVLIFTCFEAITLLVIVYEHPEVVFEHTNRVADFKSHLWTNPHFGHKNDWAMLMSFVILFCFARVYVSQQTRKLYYVVILIALATVLISLSRQAYVWTGLGMLMLGVQTRNTKLLLSFVVVISLIVIVRPDFLMERLETMINVRSMEDFQDLNRKVSSMAKEQFIQNLTFIPRMFFAEWEYNFSEGFWNGMLHQQGIIGLLFHLFVFIFMFLRYFKFFKSNNPRLATYGALAVILTFLMFLACINRRTTYFIHYKGNFHQINLILLFIFAHIELAYYGISNRLKNQKYL